MKTFNCTNNCLWEFGDISWIQVPGKVLKILWLVILWVLPDDKSSSCRKKKRGLNFLKSDLSSSNPALQFWISYLPVQICRNFHFQLLIMSVLRPPLFFPLEMCLQQQQQQMDQIKKWGVTIEYLHSYTTLMTCDSCSRGAGGHRLTDSSCFRRGVMGCGCAIFQNTCRMLVLGNNEPG